MSEDYWRLVAVLAIIFIVAESFFFGYIYYIGAISEQKENTCQLDFCENSFAYTFDPFTNKCSCYDNNRTILKEGVIE